MVLEFRIPCSGAVSTRGLPRGTRAQNARSLFSAQPCVNSQVPRSEVHFRRIDYWTGFAPVREDDETLAASPPRGYRLLAFERTFFRGYTTYSRAVRQSLESERAVAKLRCQCGSSHWECTLRRDGQRSRICKEQQSFEVLATPPCNLCSVRNPHVSSCYHAGRVQTAKQRVLLRSGDRCTE